MKNKIIIHFGFTFLFLFCICEAGMAEVKLPAIFGDGVVLQQKARVNVWGWASAGEKIVLSNSWSSKTVTTLADKKGAWMAKIQTPAASMSPRTVTIAGKNSITLKDILIGEVWVCSGQSNMGFSMKSDADAAKEIPNANFPAIRYFYVERQYGLEKFKDAPGSVWKKATPETVPNFSAVAYYFAKKIQEEMKVPVGLVYAAWGGTPAEAWTPREVLTSDTVLSKYIDRWKYIQDNAGKDSVTYQAALKTWEGNKVGKKPEEPQTFYYFNRPWREPSVLFNGMIDPVIPYSVKGVLWYQGESNVGYADEYQDLFTKMISAWRSRWERPKMPFYFVQISAFGYGDMEAAATLREAQLRTQKTVPHTGMVISIDQGNMGDIHYTHKKPIGLRMAALVLHDEYGKKIHYKGPELQKAVVKKGFITLKFRTSGGLQTDGKPLAGFEVGYKRPGTEALTYTKAEARIEGKRIYVQADNSGIPAAIRYAWLFVGDANLFDKEALPAEPFQKKM